MDGTLFLTEGGPIHLEELPAHVLTPRVLGSSLAKINRFAGRTSHPYSVAAHSVLVSRLCPQGMEQTWALLHDAHEAFLGDITAPGIEFIARKSFAAVAEDFEIGLGNAKADLDYQIAEAWGVNLDDIDLEEVAHYDRIAAEVEMAFYFGSKPSADPCDDVDRAFGLLSGLTSLSWPAARDIWNFEAEHLAKAGLCHLPTHAA